MVKKNLNYIIFILFVTLSGAIPAVAGNLYIIKPAIGKTVSKNTDNYTAELETILKDKNFKKELRKNIIKFLRHAASVNPEIKIKRHDFSLKLEPDNILIPLLYIDNVIDFSDTFNKKGTLLYKGNIYIGMSFLMFQLSSEAMVYSLPLIVSVPYLGDKPQVDLSGLATPIRSEIVNFFKNPKSLTPLAGRNLADCLENLDNLFKSETWSIGKIELSDGTLKRIRNHKKFSALTRILANQVLSQDRLVIPSKSRGPGISKAINYAVKKFGVGYLRGGDVGFSEKDNTYHSSRRLPVARHHFNIMIKTGEKTIDENEAFSSRKYATACYFQNESQKIRCLNSVKATISSRHTGVSDIYFYNALINALSDISSCKR